MLKKHFSLMAKCIDRNQKSDSSANTLSFFSLVTVLVRVFGLCYGVFSRWTLLCSVGLVLAPLLVGSTSRGS